MLSQKVSLRILKVVSVPVLAFVLLALLLALMFYSPVQADEGFAPERGQFPLIVGTSLNPTGTNHDVYEIDVVGNTSQSLLASFPVGGATYDAANDRVLFTSSQGSTNIDQLWEWPVGGALNNLGTIMDATAGGAQRIDGLAISGGILYGSYAGGTAEDGLWTIDMNTLAATLVYAFSDSVSGIDADPNTGTIYGVNDSTGNLVEIDPAGSMTVVNAYPAGQVDIDGLAVGNDGRAYLITDEPGSFYVFDFGVGDYVTPLTNPWTSADTFSGGAFIDSGPPAAPGIAVDKSPASQNVTTNGIASFTITVSNTGNVDLANVNVSDPLVPACDNAVGTLAISATVSYGCQDANVTGSYTNVVTVTGVFTGNQTTVTATDSAAVVYTSPTSVSLTGLGEGGQSSTPFLLGALVLLVAGLGFVMRRKYIS